VLALFVGTGLLVYSCRKKAGEKKTEAKADEFGSAICACADKPAAEAKPCVEKVGKQINEFEASLKSEEVKAAFNKADPEAPKPCEEKIKSIM